MDDTGTDIDAHGLFQFGNAYIVIIQCLNVVDLRFVEAQLGIEDIQVDTKLFIKIKKQMVRFSFLFLNLL